MHSYLSTKWIKAGVFGLWILMAVTTGARNGRTQQYIALEEVSRTEGCRHAVADYDLDGIDEVVTLDCDQKDVLFHEADLGMLRPVWQMPIIEGEFHRLEAYDISGNEAPEIFVSVKRGDTAWVQVFDANRNLLRKTAPITGIDQRGDDTWDGFIDKFNVLDVDRDGHKDILASITTSYDLKPRGIYAFKWETGELFWHYPTACHVTQIITSNLDGDEIEEILLATNAPSNGYTINGMDDAHTYIIALDRQGNLLWRNQTGGKFIATRIDTEDLDRDGRSEVICTFASGDIDDPKTNYELQIRDGKAGLVKKYFPLSSLGPIVLGDLNRDRVEEIVTGGRDGNLRVFNKDLEILYEFKCGSFLVPVVIEDMNQDGEPEILAQHRHGFKILSSKLEILGDYETNRSVGYWDYFKNPFHKNLLIAREGTKDDAHIVLYQFTFSKIPFSLGPVAKWGGNSIYPVAIFLFGLLIGIMVWAATPSLRRRFGDSWAKCDNVSQRREALLESLSVFGHGKLPTSNLDRLSLLFKNVPRDESRSENYRQRLHEAFHTYNEYTAARLQDIEKQAKAAKMSRTQVNTLKSDFQRMGKLASELQVHHLSMEKIQQVSQEAATLSERLEKDVKSIADELGRYFNCDVLSTVQKVLTAVEEQMTKNGIVFKGLTIHGHVGGRGFILENELVAIIEELISNAIVAMSKSSRTELSVEVVIEDRKIYINVTDTGRGISKENIQKIFNRDFSTKEGGGFGLYYAKTTLSKYGGNIRVLETELEKGTTMQIELKRVG